MDFDWEKLYRQNADTVYRFLLSRCRDRALAEDLTADTFLEAWRCRERYDGSCKVSVWLCQIARHLLYRHWAAEAKRAAAAEALRMEAEAGEASAEDSVMRRETVGEIGIRLAALNPEARRAVLLRTQDGLSFRQIGEKLGRSEVWARVTVHRALKKLREGETK